MGLDSFGVPLEELGLLYAATGDTHEADGAVLVTSLEMSRWRRSGQNRSPPAGRLATSGLSPRHSPWLFGLPVSAEIEMKSIQSVIVIEIDFDPIGACHAQTPVFPPRR